MPYIELSKTNLYYEDEGKGNETLLFGHSLLFNLRMFDDQVNYLKEYYRCVRFDFRGQGQSDKPSDGYDLDSLTDETLELIEALDCAPCHFIGFSMGGMVAMRIAVKSPEVIKSLILIDTSSEPEPPEGELRNKAMLWVAKYIGLGPLGNRVLKMFFGRHFLKDPKNKAHRKTWKNHFLANDRSAIINAVKGILYRKSFTPSLEKISHPTLILVGEEDQLTDLSKAEILHSHIENSVLKVIPRAAHMSTVEEPEFVNAAIKEFLSDQDSDSL